MMMEMRSAFVTSVLCRFISSATVSVMMGLTMTLSATSAKCLVLRQGC